MEIRVRRAKGQKDRVTMLPASAKQDLIDHLKNVKGIHDRDLREGAGRTKLPDALVRKYPHADSQWGWQFVFPASSRYFDREAGIKRRHHLDESVIQMMQMSLFPAGPSSTRLPLRPRMFPWREANPRAVIPFCRKSWPPPWKLG